jgi:hypothetical protein
MFLSLACESIEKEGVMRKFWTILSGAMIIVFLTGAGEQGPKVQTTSAQTSSIPGSAALKVDQDFGKMPLYFIPNQGQMDAQVAYYLQGKDKTIYFTSEGLTYLLSERRAGEEIAEKTASVKEHLVINPAERELRSLRDQRRFAVKLDFVGANADVRPSGEEKTGAVISYFKGKPEEWKAGLPTYSRIVYKDLWPGIDVAYYGTVDKMKYEFVVHPGADPGKIRLAYRGASGVRVNKEGQLEMETPFGNFHDDKPLAYQEIGGKRASVPLAYLVEDMSRDGSIGDSQEVEAETRSYSYGFRVGEYDQSQPLILDPAVFVYCGYIGGSNVEYGYGIAVDSSGYAYITGYTGSTEDTFPASVGPDLTYNDGYEDAFVAKVKSDGTGLVYCGYIGGGGDERGNGIAVDASGCAYITGYTSSSQVSLPVAFPVTVGPGLTFNGGYCDAFVAKVKSDGTGLVYCGYIGGSGDDYGQGIAVDKLNYPYITGYTNSDQSSFPITTGPNHQGFDDAFVAEINPNGIGFYYCRYIGGSGGDKGYGIAVDSSYNAYIIGTTDSSESYNFPVTVGPDLTHNGGSDVFVAKVNSSGSTLLYCGYIGGSDTDVGYGIAVDSSGCAYVTGQTASTQATFPESVGPDLTYNGSWDAFAAKVKADGSGLVYCGYIGGSSDDYGQGIAVDSSGNAYITGYTWSDESTFPVTVGPDLTYNDSGGASFSDAFVAKVKASGMGLVYCGYIGGDARDRSFGIAVDSSHSAYVTGTTTSDSTTFPAKVGPSLNVKGYDAFVAKIFSIQKDDFLGTWDGQGVYYRNSDTGAWVKMASPATLITAGDLGGDGVDDLIGIWPSQGGVWAKSSTNGAWTKLSTTAEHIAAGDMNGDGRVDFLGTWDGQGVFYRDSVSSSWVKMASPATLITAGDLDGDGKDDLIGIWPSQGGVWVKYSKTAGWSKLSSTAEDIAAGDMNGDGRDDLLATWDGQGVYYQNSMNGAWVKMATPADQVTCGDLDGDGKADLIGIWPTQGGVWVKYSATGSWAKLSSSARDIAAGKMRAGTGGSMLSQALFGPMGGYAQGPESLIQYQDTSSEGPGGLHFVYQTEELLIPQEHESGMMRIPGPGEPGFRCAEEKNLFPKESRESDATKEDRDRSTK